MNLWDWQGAEDDVNRSLNLRKTSNGTQAAANLAIVRGDLTGAERLLRGALALDPLDTFTLAQLAMNVYTGLGRFEEAAPLSGRRIPAPQPGYAEPEERSAARESTCRSEVQRAGAQDGSAGVTVMSASRIAVPTLTAIVLGFGAWVAGPGAAAAPAEVDAAYPKAYALYLDLHQHPELSSVETQTAAKLAAQLRALGYKVTEHVGGTGVVAVMENGPGKTVMLRTELDALPVEEKTGLPFASKVHAKDPAGVDVPVGHMCGHDVHMSALVATAAIMAHSRDSWHGTLMLIGQPAEETVGGAKGMISDGLFSRFPRPDVAVALHVGNEQPAGKVGVASGTFDSNADSVRITLYGKGGHGSAPHTTVDPIVMAARTILALQTIAAREVKPGEFAVVTVGYIKAGTKNNIIPDQAELGLTVRTYKDEVRKQVLAAITRIANAEAQSAGAPRPPLIENYETTDSVYNDPALAQRMRATLERALGHDNVVTQEPLTASEDFSVFVEQGIPGFYLALGGADPEKYAQAKASGTHLPSNHSSLFAPDIDPALHTAITAEVAMLRDLLGSAGVPTAALR
jgi:amidohydrolase